RTLKLKGLGQPQGASSYRWPVVATTPRPPRAVRLWRIGPRGLVLRLEALAYVRRARRLLAEKTFVAAREEMTAAQGPRRAGRAPADEVGRAVESAARFVPGAMCVARSLAAQAMLVKRGVPSRIHFGFRRLPDGSVDGHAWVEVAGNVVAGDVGLDDFTRTATFDACGRTGAPRVGRGAGPPFGPDARPCPSALPLEVRAQQHLRGELLHADVGGVEERHVVAPEETLGPPHLELAALQGRVVRARAALRAQLVQPPRVDGEAEELVPERRQRLGERLGLQVLLHQREVRGPHAVRHGQVEAGGALAHARDAHHDHLGVRVPLHVRAVVGVQRELDGFDARLVARQVPD